MCQKCVEAGIMSPEELSEQSDPAVDVAGLLAGLGTVIDAKALMAQTLRSPAMAIEHTVFYTETMEAAGWVMVIGMNEETGEVAAGWKHADQGGGMIPIAVVPEQYAAILREEFRKGA